MSRERLEFLHRGVVAGCALAALVMLAAFYSVVSSATGRASLRHAELALQAPAPVLADVSKANGRRLERRPVLLAGAAD